MGGKWFVFRYEMGRDVSNTAGPTVSPRLPWATFQEDSNNWIDVWKRTSSKSGKGEFNMGIVILMF